MAEQGDAPTKGDKVLRILRLQVSLLLSLAVPLAIGMVSRQVEGAPFYCLCAATALYVIDMMLAIWARERRGPPRVVHEWKGLMMLEGTDAERMQQLMGLLTKEQAPPSGLN